MQRLHFFRFFTIISCFLLILAPVVHAASIKERMAARIPAINALKDKGTIGENNKGFLEFRTGDKSSAKLVTEENKDRSTVYSMIAKKQGASPALVGQRRAKMIVENGPKGHWYQKPDNSWYKK